MRSRFGVTLFYLAMLLGWTMATSAPTQTPTFQPTKPTESPTHGPTNLPSKAPTWSPTVPVGSDQDIKIVATVVLEGEEVTELCEKSNLKDYASSLESVFSSASGVSSDDITKTEITDCENANDEATLTYEMRSTNSRSLNTVNQRAQSGKLLSSYQENLNLVFNDVQATSLSVETEVAEKEKDSDDPFDDFFSKNFGLGVVIIVVSSLWLWFLKSDQTEDKTRLNRLQTEKREFESKYGKLEPMGYSNETQTADMVQMVENTKTVESDNQATDNQETNM